QQTAMLIQSYKLWQISMEITVISFFYSSALKQTNKYATP
ncbi:12747_t:CDS:1, partial [Funneliformis caledonium]